MDIGYQRIKLTRGRIASDRSFVSYHTIALALYKYHCSNTCLSVNSTNDRGLDGVKIATVHAFT